MSDNRFLVDDSDKCANATVLPGGCDPKRLQLIFRDIIRIRIERFKHRVDAFPHEFLRFNLIYIIRIYFLEKGRVNIEALRNVKVFFGRSERNSTKDKNSNNDWPSKTSPHNLTGFGVEPPVNESEKLVAVSKDNHNR